ncbi:hypothetical protein LTR70_002672 [Exophiala xenobiotica]|uniref:Tafazzin n=1 Tax=Lithohypha guttulata TaxID=1690604 RepID=A0ABR0KJD9_9EURO|nr:hypothetical protein LTR24_001778 [Lithohypha guttulata]KAK5324599.1 hypothetical protein LTR70_002672 [Exophiala xenobiotica]
MPKKHQNRALLTKPASSAPSTHKSIASSSGSHGEPAPPSRSVNELLRESRRTKGQQRVDIAATASLHPTLRAVLDMPAPSPPTRTHVRGPARLRRIPGPPPPQSWLADSQHAPESSRSMFQQLRWLRARIQQQSSTLPGGKLPKQTSLEHAVLKAIATNWSWHAEYDNTYLATLPVSTRVTLLSYLAVYNEAHWPNPFPLLFPPDCEQDELDEVTRLDLANSIGGWATTVKKVEKELVVMNEVATKHVTDRAPPDQAEVPESWEDQPKIADREPRARISAVSSMPKMLTSGRFGNLLHLSLAVNLASASAPPSWASLIALSTHLSQLKSLSLAHWPTPTYTPNAAKGRVRMVNTALPSLPNQPFGGTDLYSAFDNDWREAAGILRSLSRNLYCLSWLDLSGCGPWLTALTWHDEKAEAGSAEWNGAWRNVSNVILGVGWLPGRPSSVEDEISSTSKSSSSIDSARAIEQLYGSSESIQASLGRLSELRLSTTRGVPADQGGQQSWNVEDERAKQYFKKDIERYHRQQSTAKEVAGQIRGVRRAANGRYIEFEFGQELGAEYENVE